MAVETRAKQILTRFERLSASRAHFENSWQDIADHVLGRRDFTTERTPGHIRTATIYDNTGMLAAGLLSGGLHTLLTNSATKWFKLKLEDDRLAESDIVGQWLQFAEDQMYSAFNRPEARFMPQMHEVYTDVVAFGTSALYIEDDAGRGVRFSARPLAEIYVAENQFGVIDTFFQKIPFTARQALMEWGEGRVPKAKKLVDKGQPEEKLNFLRFIRPNNDVVPGNHDRTGMPWAATWLSQEEKRIVFKGGFHEMPLLVARWSTDAGETYGRGPGMQSLPNAKMTNEINKTTLKAAQKATDPPLLVDDDGVLTQIRTSPGSINVQRSTHLGRDAIRPLVTTNPDVGVNTLERERVQVRAAFHFELLQLLQDPRMTATQVIELSNRTAQLLSPIVGRLQVELLEPMIDRVFAILLRQGRFGRVPEELADQDVRVEYVSPVARAQKDGDAQAIVELFTIGANLAQVDPSVLDNLDSDEAMRLIAKAKDAPLSVLRSPEVVLERREAAAKVAQEQAQLQQAVEGAGAISKVLPAITAANDAGGGEATEAV